MLASCSALSLNHELIKLTGLTGHCYTRRRENCLLYPLRTKRFQFSLQCTLQLGHEGKASKNVWITDCVVLPNAKKLALSSADREIGMSSCIFFHLAETKLIPNNRHFEFLCNKRYIFLFHYSIL